eukprot:Awhi_evm2s6916
MMFLRNTFMISVLAMGLVLQPEIAGVSGTPAKATVEKFVEHVKNFDHKNDKALMLHHERMKREACRFSTCEHDSDCPDWCDHCTSGLFQRYCET